MRLTAPERTAIKEIIRRLDERAEIFLFGSRTDDRLRGGDIDLLILSEKVTFGDRLDLLAKLRDALGDQKIDLVVQTAREAASSPFVEQIKKSALPL